MIEEQTVTIVTQGFDVGMDLRNRMMRDLRDLAAEWQAVGYAISVVIEREGEDGA